MAVVSTTNSPVRLDQVDAALVSVGRLAGCNGSKVGTTTTISALDPAVTQAQLDTAVATAVAGYDPNFGRANAKIVLAAVAANTTYLALANPTVPQNTAQIKTLTSQIQALIQMVANGQA